VGYRHKGNKYFERGLALEDMAENNPKFKPNYLKTPEEKDEVARKFESKDKRPDTEDWSWYDKSS